MLAVFFTVIFVEAVPTPCGCDKSLIANATQEKEDISKLETQLKFNIGIHTRLKYQGPRPHIPTIEFKDKSN